MEPQHNRPSSLVPLLVVVFLGAGISFLLILATGRFFLYVLLGILAIVGFCYTHYLLWGRAMVEEMAREKLQQAADMMDEEDDWKVPESRFRS